MEVTLIFKFALKTKKIPNISFWIYKTLDLFKNSVRHFYIREGTENPNKSISQ